MVPDSRASRTWPVEDLVLAAQEPPKRISESGAADRLDSGTWVIQGRYHGPGRLQTRRPAIYQEVPRKVEELVVDDRTVGMAVQAHRTACPVHRAPLDGVGGPSASPPQVLPQAKSHERCRPVSMVQGVDCGVGTAQLCFQPTHRGIRRPPHAAARAVSALRQRRGHGDVRASRRHEQGFEQVAHGLLGLPQVHVAVRRAARVPADEEVCEKQRGRTGNRRSGRC